MLPDEEPYARALDDDREEHDVCATAVACIASTLTDVRLTCSASTPSAALE
jgi:hypothetical protein